MKAATQTASPHSTVYGLQTAATRRLSLRQTIAAHWPEYAMEATLIALFMTSATVFGVLFEHPASPVRTGITSALVRRTLMGFAMGSTAIALTYSPWGKRSGAHYNPAVTLVFFRLGKIAGFDAAMYMVVQMIGGVLGVLVGATLVGGAAAHPAVRYVVTLPGSFGTTAALGAELTISFLLMSTVLYFAASVELANLTGMAAGALVALFITFEAPISGMSMNFARTFGSAFSARVWTGLWIYLIAPLAGMLAAAEVHMRWNKRARQHCGKLHHDNHHRCIFCGANGGFQI